MKKILALVFAFAAVFCFAGCENGKCDDCGVKNDYVKVYEKLDGKEYCFKCAAKAAAEKAGENWEDLEDELEDIEDELGDLLGK